jgi:hypothetical protein
VTDGETLFHVERTLVQDTRSDLLVELEDCATLELVVRSTRTVSHLGLRPVAAHARRTLTAPRHRLLPGCAGWWTE